MKVVLDSKLLIYRAEEFAILSNQLMDKQFKITRSNEGDLDIVKFENIKVDVFFTDTYKKPYQGNRRTEVKFKVKEKTKYLADSMIISNKKIKFIGTQNKGIKIVDITQLQLSDTAILLFTDKHKYQLETKSFKLNVYLLIILEWVSSNQIDEQFEDKTIKFNINQKRI